MYISTKTFGHEVGLSAAFRQWKAESHCRFLHGYALAVKFVFEAQELDHRNWVVDFGSLKGLKSWLEDTFDHKTLVAEDDPQMDYFNTLDAQGIIQMVVVPATGCEKFAEMIFECTEVWLKDNGYAPRVRLLSVEVREHGANSAIYTRLEGQGKNA
jgi:6-pyruvoyltetrahydropterin/6-carboxytetrahydropterin synthase